MLVDVLIFIGHGRSSRYKVTHGRGEAWELCSLADDAADVGRDLRGEHRRCRSQAISIALQAYQGVRQPPEAQSGPRFVNLRGGEGRDVEEGIALAAG